ncbi:hypothetical protein NDU88_006583 [Pleurodeles waltl]|uniref:Uncharacterized protein n=1 Tax=Pleurodeles waltl TaxID=8319 RepID=A0AAV7PK49_PLEWA|nr:hypothetical protein NDU88_006583 [Pleurodeles waltl]
MEHADSSARYVLAAAHLVKALAVLRLYSKVRPVSLPAELEGEITVKEDGTQCADRILRATAVLPLIRVGPACSRSRSRSADTSTSKPAANGPLRAATVFLTLMRA